MFSPLMQLNSGIVMMQLNSGDITKKRKLGKKDMRYKKTKDFGLFSLFASCFNCLFLLSLFSSPSLLVFSVYFSI